MYEGFKERAAQVKQLLGSPEAGFVLVTSPQALTIGEALQFHEQLGKYRFYVGAVIANRVQPPTGVGDMAAFEAALRKLPAAAKDLPERLRQALADAETLWRADQNELARLRQAGIRPLELRQRDRDVHDLPALAALAEELSRAA
jgi:anion-transporting  ArsA/GET3 family ATPase